MWRHPRHAPLAFLHQGQPCLWSSHRRQRRAPHVGKSQGARQRPPHKLRAAEQQIPARSIPHSCEKSPLRQKADSGRTKPAPAESRLRSHQARSGGKPTPVAPSPLQRKADSGRTKAAPAESRLRSHQTRFGGKTTPVALSRLWWLSPAESRLRSHPRLYISVSPTLRGPTGNKAFSFVTR